MNKTKLLCVALIGASLLISGCSTISSVADSVNPFDKTEADKKAEQGAVAGEEQRISLISADETLITSTDITPQDVILPDVYVNEDWPMPGGNVQHAMQRTVAGGGLDRIWTRDVGDGSSRKGRVVASPVISGGKIFVMDGENRVSAYDANSGAPIWRHDIKVESQGRTREGRANIFERVTNPFGGDGGGSDKESVGGGIAAADGKLFVTSGLGTVEALEARSGNVAWRKRLTTPMHSAPIVSNGRLFAISDDNELFALNSATGEVLWTYQGIVESARMLTSPSPAVIDDVVIAPFSSGELVALRVQNGVVLWQDALSSPGRLTPLSSLNDIASGPVIADGYVIATAQSGVISAFDLRNGQRIWSQPAGSLGYPWVAGDFVFTITTNGEIVCLSKISGDVVWTKQLRAFKNEKKRKERIAWAGPIMLGDKMLVVSSRGEAVEFNPYDGSIVREYKLKDPVFVPPIIANQTVYILDDKARLTALR
ncbi:MAG: PQQ-binding-like beta-propeller repeat protein [Hellea sp.]|nr:PQQ-binding-like beta-propeller repeat protein [Hellea sp.]